MIKKTTPGDPPDTKHYHDQIEKTKMINADLNRRIRSEHPSPQFIADDWQQALMESAAHHGKVSDMGISREELNAHLKAMQEENLRMASETRSEIRIGLADLKATFADKSKEQWKSFVTLGISLAVASVAILGFMINTLKSEEKPAVNSQPIIITVPSAPQQESPTPPTVDSKK